MPKNIEEKTVAFLEQNNLLPLGTKVLLAVSGGADSVALVEILTEMKLSGRINNDFHIAHINHQLRGEKSLEDEKFVKALAQKHKLPVTIEQADVKKYAQENRLSIETAGRNLRLEKLAITAKRYNCDCVAAAHQKNDNAETIIHRMLRGTAFKGLAGIRPKTILNGTTFIRPLLCLDHSEIEDYLVSQNIKWQTDHTNSDCRFTRNRIRHQLLPMLQSQSHNDLVELLFVLSRKCLAFSEHIERQAKTALQDCVINQSEDFVSVDIDKFNDYPSLLKI
jgi:tRNA(Ile)-lysidine synthase